MAKTDLGEKQVCPSCTAKFYDLRRRPALCPKCAFSFDPSEESLRVKRGRSRVAAHAVEEDEEEAAAAKAKPDDEEAEGAGEIEAEPEIVVAEDEDAAAAAAAEDEIPEGFSEVEPEPEDDAADDDSVPMLEDETEFPEDEIGALPAKAEDDEVGR